MVDQTTQRFRSQRYVMQIQSSWGDPEFCLGNSLERIQQYVVIEQEPKPDKQGVPPAYWPTSGELIVDGLSARYSPVRQISLNVMAMLDLMSCAGWIYCTEGYILPC